MTDSVVAIAGGKAKNQELSKIPADLTGQWADAFHELADIVAVQSGMVPADVEMIAAVVRAQRRTALHEALALKALKNEDQEEFAAQSRLANSASSSARAGLTQLKAHPAIRAAKMAKAKMGEDALGGDEDWKDLL